MTKKKSGFLTFCFSLIPGAGEMYMGFMKQGISIMALFWLLIFLSTFLSLGPILFILPILWCYSFFNVHNIRGMSDEEFYALQDDYLFHMDRVLFINHWGRKQNNVFATVMIFIGVVLFPSEIYWGVIENIPQLVVALFLIWAGYSMIRGKKKELEDKSMEREER